VAQLDGAMGEPIPLACADWANTKAAYRFLSNEDVSEGEILAGHFASTGERIRAAGGPCGARTGSTLTLGPMQPGN